MGHEIDVKLKSYVTSVYTPTMIWVYLSGYFIASHFLPACAYGYFYLIFYVAPHHHVQLNQ